MREPVARQQVLGHVGVEAGAEDAGVALHDERERSPRKREQRHRGADPKGLPRPLDPPPEEEDRPDRRDQNHESRGRPAPWQPHGSPGDRAEKRQSDGR